MTGQEHEPSKFWAIYGTSKRWAWRCECGGAAVGFESIRTAEDDHKMHADAFEQDELRKQVRG